MKIVSPALLRSILRHEVKIDGNHEVTHNGIYLYDFTGVKLEKLIKGDVVTLKSEAKIWTKNRAVLVSWEPKFYSHGRLSAPTIVAPGSDFSPLVAHFEALRALSLNKLEYLAKLYIFD